MRSITLQMTIPKPGPAAILKFRNLGVVLVNQYLYQQQFRQTLVMWFLFVPAAISPNFWLRHQKMSKNGNIQICKHLLQAAIFSYGPKSRQIKVGKFSINSTVYKMVPSTTPLLKLYARDSLGRKESALFLF
jgi:hypothetical protein